MIDDEDTFNALRQDSAADTAPPESLPTIPSMPIAPKPRGFAALSPERVRELASKGGKSAHAQGVAYQWDSAAAKAAGRKGGSRAKKVRP